MQKSEIENYREIQHFNVIFVNFDTYFVSLLPEDVKRIS